MSAPQPLPSRPDTAPQVCSHCGLLSSAVLNSDDCRCPDCDAAYTERMVFWLDSDAALEARIQAELSAPPAPIVARQPPPPIPTKATEAGTPPARLPLGRIPGAVLDWLLVLCIVVGLTGVGLVITVLAAGVWLLIGLMPR